ncbi:MAG: hypothetical protein ACK5XE_10575 [Burkholderiales bacterium]
MTNQHHQKDTVFTAETVSTPPQASHHQTLYTVAQFHYVEPSFSLAALRNLIFKAQPRHSSQGVIPGNGLIECGAIVRIGRKVLINREKFLDWVQQ